MDFCQSTGDDLKLRLFDKIKGIIYGAALGDAVGLSTEFMTEEQAKVLYGVGPIKFGKADGYEFWRDRHRSRWFPNDFTDDTDQMLLILQCLLSTDGHLIPSHFAYRLQEWTNKGFPEINKIACGIGYTVGSVLSHPEFISNPHKASYDVWDSKGRNLAANGAVMRTSVLGVPYFWDEEKVVENSILAAKVTHADPRSVISAVITSVVISRLLQSSILDNLPNRDTTSIPEKADIHKHTLQIFECGSPHSDYHIFSHESLKQYDFTLKPKVTFQHPPLAQKGLLERLSTFIPRKKNNELEVLKALLPQYEEPESSRLKNPAKMPNTLPRSIDDYETDGKMLSLCKNVVDKYEFLLRSSSLCPQQFQLNSENSSDTPESNWIDELHAHCFPSKLSHLKLSEPGKIGYTFKCLGSATYSLTRAKPSDQPTGEFFKNVITELTLQAGDADTNCAVAGALLGCRIGMKGLPKDWVEGLRHFDFLENLSDQLCHLAWSKFIETHK